MSERRQGLGANAAVRRVCEALKAAGIPDSDAAFEALCLVRAALDGQDPRLAGALIEPQAVRLRALCARRAAREPLQYILGRWPFLDVELEVGPGVLIPREDTEVLCLAAADCLRRMGAADVTAAGWFMMAPELMEGGDVSLSEEDAFEELVREGGYDVVFADRAFLPGMKGFQGQMVPLTHFAVSGRLVD